MPDACHNKLTDAGSQRYPGTAEGRERWSPAPRSRRALLSLAVAALALAFAALLALPSGTALARPAMDTTAVVVSLDQPTATIIVSGTPYPLSVTTATPAGLEAEHLLLVGEAVQVSVDWGATITPEPTLPAGQVALQLRYTEPLPAQAPDESRLAVYFGTADAGPWTRIDCVAPTCTHSLADNNVVLDLTQTGYYVLAAPAISAVLVSPHPAAVLKGRSVQLYAQVTDYAGVVVNGAAVTWEALPSVGTIDQTGLLHAAGDLGTYLAAVTAHADSLAGSATVVIEPWPMFLPAAANVWSRRVVPNDAYYGAWQSNMPQIDAPLAWSMTTGTGGPIVAIIDSGIDLDHPDLKANVVDGYDFVNGDTTAEDDYGHGTHVAGIVGAIGNNVAGVAGLGWSTRLMPVKVLDAAGSGDASVAATAIRWAVDHGARVLNLSLGTTGYSPSMAEAVQYAINSGCVVVAASGNLSSQIARGTAVYPAAYPGVIAVGAVDRYSTVASFSNRGSFLDVVAPGVGIISTYMRGGYRQMEGTSMATPHVAGVAALVWASRPALTGSQVSLALTSSTTDLGPAGWDETYGYGLINAFRAVTRPGSWETGTQDEQQAQAFVAPQPTELEPGTYNPGVLWVRLESGVSAASVLGADAALQGMAADPYVADLVRVTVTAGSEQEALLRLLDVPGVEAVYPDYKVFAM